MFVKVAEADAVKAGAGMAVDIVGKDIALFNVAGEFYAVENVCPHAGAPIDNGWMEGEVVICPWHGWEINVRTGEVVFDPRTCVASYPCKVEDGAVLIDV